jgi:hypothetical protein
MELFLGNKCGVRTTHTHRLSLVFTASLGIGDVLILAKSWSAVTAETRKPATKFDALVDE